MRGYIPISKLPLERALPLLFNLSSNGFKIDQVTFEETDIMKFRAYNYDCDCMVQAAVNSAITIQNGEVTTGIAGIDAGDALFWWLVGARVQPTLTTYNGSGGYWGGYTQEGAVSYHKYAKIYVGFTELGSFSKSLSFPVWVRFRLDGTALTLRVWENGTTEPSSWDLSVTDSQHSSGGLGLMYGAGERHSEWGYNTVRGRGIGFDTGGFNAPLGQGQLRTISGQVTLGGSPVQGATVIAVRDGFDWTKPGLIGIDFAKATTDANGNYTISLDCDTGPYHVFAFYSDGGVKYTAEARPYISV